MKESTQNYVKEIFLKYGEKVQFKIGQSISSNKYISGTVFFIERMKHGYPWVPTDIRCQPWISMATHGFQWPPMDFHGYLTSNRVK